MDTRHLRAFLKIAETGSISRAADALGLAQPSLSQQLLRLEDELGFKLFERTARGVAITETGRVFERHARLILESAERAVEELRQMRAQARARVTLAMPFSISRNLGAALVDAAMEKGPGVSLRLVEAFSHQIKAMIEAGSVDLGLLFEVESLDRLSFRPLARDEMFLIGPPGRWPGLESGASLPEKDLADLPLIVPAPEHGLRQFLQHTSQRLGIRLNIASEVDSLQHIAGLVADGRGYSLLPLAAIERDLEAGALSAIRVGDGFRGTLYLARRPDAVVTDAIRMVEDLTVSMIETMVSKRRYVAPPPRDAP